MLGLKKLRKAGKITQAKLAEELHISREAISMYETGKREPSIRMLISLSDRFGVSIDYLIRGEDYRY